MTPEETQTALLTDWLQSPPGTPAPEGLDPDVVAAVYTLRPDRAPPLQLSIDAILDGVQSGPFAVGVTRAGLEGGSSRKVVGRSARPPTRRTRSRAWWAIPGVGVSVAAFAVVVIAVKVGSSMFLQSPEMARFEQAPMSAAAPVAPVPVAATQSAPAPEQNAAAAAPAPPPPAGDAPSATPAAPTLADGAAGTADPARTPSVIAEAEAPAAQSGPTAAFDAPRDLEATVPASPGEAPAASGSAVGGASARLDSSSKTASDAVSSELARPDRAAASESADMASGDDEDLAVQKEKKSEATRRTPAPAAAPAPASAQAQGGGGGSATPFDYNPRFYTAYPELTTSYAAAIADESAGRYSTALTVYAGFLVSPHTDVAQDAAWRAARCLRALGRLDDALTTVQTGLRRSSANTPYRSNLYALEGELYNAQGKSADAAKAWSEAAKLNSAR